MAMVWLGNLTAGGIVTLLAFFLKEHMNTVLDIFFVIVILVLLLFIVRTALKMVKNKKQAKLQAEGGSAQGADVSQDGETSESIEVSKDVVNEENIVENCNQSATNDEIKTAHTAVKKADGDKSADKDKSNGDGDNR